MPKTEIVKVGNDEIEATRDDKGSGWVLVKRVCEVFGLKPDAQRKRLLRQAWATTSIMEVVAADGKKHQQFCLSVESTPMWLATLQTSRTNAKIRPRLIQFQKLAAKALADWAYGRNNGQGSSFQFDKLNDTLEQLGKSMTTLTAQVMSLKFEGISRALPGKNDTIPEDEDLADVSPRKIRKLLGKVVSRWTDHGHGYEFRSGWDWLYRMYGREAGIDLHRTAISMSQTSGKEVKPLDLAEKWGHLISLYRFAQSRMRPGAPRPIQVLTTSEPVKNPEPVTAEYLSKLSDFDSFYD
jgi:hypothetical protein